MSDFLNRTFSRREKVLMLALVVVLLVGLYFLLVHYPIVTRMDEIREETDEVLLQQEIADARLAVYNSMKAELDQIDAMPADELTEMPEYDNAEDLLLQLNRIFASTNQQISFDQIRYEGNVAMRTLHFSFDATGYAQARSVIKDLTGTGYRCLLDSLSFSPSDEGGVEDGALSVSGTITFYELDPNMSAAPATTGEEQAAE